MEQEIQEELEKVYIFPVQIDFVDFGKYKISFKIDTEEICFIVIYNSAFTREINIQRFVQEIDKSIINCYKKLPF